MITQPVSKSVFSKKQVWRRIAALFGILLCLLLLDYDLYPRLARPTGPSFNRGENGLWLRYKWYFGEETNVSVLAERLQTQQIRYAYFHVRDITKDGMLRYHHPEVATRLVRPLHRQLPKTKIIAWVYAGNVAGKGNVDLSRPEVRQKMVQEAVWLVTDCGFDGVQWDYEICPSGDADFLRLLRETRTALPHGKLLSVAVPLWLPAPLSQLGWRESDFSDVAGVCDQMTVMCYDSGCYLPRTYVWLVHQQVVHVTRAVAQRNKNCRVLFGVPTYGAGGLSHHAPAENIGMALIGVRAGLADPQSSPSVAAGVAVFADYTTQSSEWQTYQKWWCQP